MQVHVILGVGNLEKNCDTCMEDDDYKEACGSFPSGAMGDTRASPNDPVFINHHAMIDLIFEKWLQQHPNAMYGGPPSNSKFPGHAAGDCAVPFIPVITHSQAFQHAENFGYYYTPLEEFDDTTDTPPTTTGSSSILVTLSLVIAGAVLTLMTVLP